jgi:Protein of unknown function (DUF3987)
VDLKKEIKVLETQKNSPPSIWTEDATLAGMRNSLALNSGQLSMISDDAGKALQNLLGEHSNLQKPEDNILLKGYSVSDVSVERAGIGSVFIPEVWISLFWLTQPDKLALLTESQWLKEGGFLARCLIARYACAPHVMSDDSVSQELLDEYWQKWDRIFSTYRQGFLESGESKEIKVSDGARGLMKQWEKHIVGLRKGTLSDFDLFSARWVENTWKLAGLLHVARNLEDAHKHPIRCSEIKRAIEIMEFFNREQLSLMHQSREEKHGDNLAKYTQLLAKKSGEMTLGALKNSGHNPDEVLAFARQNPSFFEVVESEDGKRGRPSVKIRLLNKVVQKKGEPPIKIEAVGTGDSISI